MEDQSSREGVAQVFSSRVGPASVPSTTDPAAEAPAHHPLTTDFYI